MGLFQSKPSASAVRIDKPYIGALGHLSHDKAYFDACTKAAENFSLGNHLETYQICDELCEPLRQIVATDKQEKARQISSRDPKRKLADCLKDAEAQQKKAQSILDRFAPVFAELRKDKRVADYVQNGAKTPSKLKKSTLEAAALTRSARMQRDVDLAPAAPPESDVQTNASDAAPATSSQPSVTMPGDEVRPPDAASPPPHDSTPITVTLKEIKFTEVDFAADGTFAIGDLGQLRNRDGTSHYLKVVEVFPDGLQIRAENFLTDKPFQGLISVEALRKKGTERKFTLLIPVAEKQEDDAETSRAIMHLDSASFERCIGQINTAKNNINIAQSRAVLTFSTQLIRDIEIGSFRAEDYDQAFIEADQHFRVFTTLSRQAIGVIRGEQELLKQQKAAMSPVKFQKAMLGYSTCIQSIETASQTFSTLVEEMRAFQIRTRKNLQS